MKVRLIHYTGTPDQMYAARLLLYAKNTRLTQGEDTHNKIAAMEEDEVINELSTITNTIRSSWEFVDYTFEITGVTRAFTHQFVRTRTASYAQQAQRVADMSAFETLIPQSVRDVDMEARWNDLMGAIQDFYIALRAKGVPAQDARGVLPTNVLTNIIAKMNLRTLADLVGKRDNLRAQDEYQMVIRAMAYSVLDVHPWAEAFLWPERTRTPELDAILRDKLGNASPVDQPKLNTALKELDQLKATWG